MKQVCETLEKLDRGGVGGGGERAGWRGLEGEEGGIGLDGGDGNDGGDLGGMKGGEGGVRGGLNGGSGRGGRAGGGWRGEAGGVLVGGCWYGSDDPAPFEGAKVTVPFEVMPLFFLCFSFAAPFPLLSAPLRAMQSCMDGGGHQAGRESDMHV